jgi:hypothetical protein
MNGILEKPSPCVKKKSLKKVKVAITYVVTYLTLLVKEQLY